MPQGNLPVFGAGATEINRKLAYEKREGRIYYFNGLMPVFSHEEEDLASFRLITSQFVVNGNCTQMEIVRSFGVSVISVKRYVKKLREEGGKGFFKKKRSRSGAVLTAEVLAEVQRRLWAGESPGQIARTLEVKVSTLLKAIGDGRLKRPEKKTMPEG